MQSSDKTARQLFAEVKANPTRKRFGFGRMPALINVDPQKAYTCVGEFATAYETDPRQLEYINALAAEFRARGFPVVWTHVAYMESGEDCGIWGTRTNTPDSLQNIKAGSRRAEFDDRLVIDFVTPSIGIALFPQHAKQAESLIKAADIAMYEAKQQRNRACLYTPPELSTPT